MSSESKYVVFVQGDDKLTHEWLVPGFPYADRVAIHFNDNWLQVPLPQEGIIYGDTLFFVVDLQAGTATYIPNPAVLGDTARIPLLASLKDAEIARVLAETSKWTAAAEQANAFAEGHLPMDELLRQLSSLPTIKVSAVQVHDSPNPIFWKVRVSAPVDDARSKAVRSYVDTGAELCLADLSFAKEMALPKGYRGQVALEGFGPGPAVVADVVRVRVHFPDGFEADANAAVCPTQARFGSPFVIGQGVYNAYTGGDKK